MEASMDTRIRANGGVLAEPAPGMHVFTYPCLLAWMDT